MPIVERVFKEPKPGEKHIGEILQDRKEQLRTFKRRFLWFWIGMLCLYVSFSCQHTYQASLKEVKDPAADDISLSVSLKGQLKEDIFKGDLNLSIGKAHADESKISKRNRILSREEALKQLAFPFLNFLFNNLTLLFIFWCFLVLYIRPDEVETNEARYMVGSGVVVLILTLLFPLFPRSPTSRGRILRRQVESLHLGLRRAQRGGERDGTRAAGRPARQQAGWIALVADINTILVRGRAAPFPGL
jgi:hypothetical protein